MTDVKDTSTEAEEKNDASEVSGAPAIDGSVDALVANLRAAKEQLAELLASADKTATNSSEEAAETDRSAA